MKLLIALSLVLALPRIARGDESGAAAVRAKVSAMHLPPDQAGAVLAPLDHAAAAHLPDEPVAAKILEGLAKGVPAARVAAAAETVVQRLGDAQAALDAAHPPAVSDRGRALAALALAESRLGSRENLLALATSAPGATVEGLVAAAGTVADLREAGVPVERAVPLAGGLAAHGYRPEQIAAVPKLLQQFRAEGGQDVGAFVDELSRRAARQADLNDVVDPFGKGGQVIRHSEEVEPKHHENATRGEGQGPDDRPLVGSPDRGGSNPAVNDDWATKTGRGKGHPPNGATGGGGGKGKGKGHGNAGTADDPGTP